MRDWDRLSEVLAIPEHVRWRYKNAENMYADHISLRLGLRVPSSGHLFCDRRFNVKMSVGVQITKIIMNLYEKYYRKRECHNSLVKTH